ncbi:MFS transporter [Paenibacillus humicola]|uniref:MFS transporter n=1 Tax=Paenibacillus humicola TaxID=3110540 RepID=UPI00237B70DD|nr:MFS transporter [Paenibacillus humicola]
MSMVQDWRSFTRLKGAPALLSALIAYGIGTGMLAPMNAIYLRDSIGLSKGQIAAVFAVSLLLNMALTLVTGLFSDRMRYRKGLPLAAIVVCITGLQIYMRADAFPGAMLGMCLAVAPSGLIMGQLFAMARSRLSKGDAALTEMAMIWLRAGFSVGFFIGLLLGANVYLWFSFHGVLWGNSLGYAVLGVLLLLFREVPADGLTAAKKSGGEPFSHLMLLALLLLCCADSIRGLYLPLVVNATFGRPELMSYLWSCQAVFELLFMTVTGYAAAKYGSRKVIWIGSLAAIAVYALYAFSTSLPLYFVAQPINSFYVSILYGVAMGYVQRMFLHRTGFGASLYVLITQTASLVGYILPQILQGTSHIIFFIPIVLVAVSLLLSGTVILRSARQASGVAAKL